MEKVTAWASKLFLKDPKPFSDKRDLDVSKLAKVGGGLVVLVVIGLIAWPTPPPEATVFNEQRDSSGRIVERTGSELQDNTLSQFHESQMAARDPSRRVPSLSELMGENAQGGHGSGSGGRSLGASMILMRSGFDAKTQLSQGTRIQVRVVDTLSLVASGSMPIRGVVEMDIEHESTVAIPKGSQVLGEAAFNSSLGRAQVIWKQLVFSDGRMRELAAIGIGRDGKPGIEGNVHSGAVLATTGKLLGRFVGAFAEGSMTRTQTGESEGGYENGLKNAVGETARDQADSWAEDLKTTNPWMELKAGTLSTAILTEAFAFREAGSVR